MIDSISLDEKFATLREPWSPRVVGELNGQHARIVRCEGEFVWHHHDDVDELFLVHRGTLRIELRDGAVELGPGQLCVIPRGVEHRPVSADGAEVLLFEPAATRNTGNVTNELTVESPSRI